MYKQSVVYNVFEWKHYIFNQFSKFCKTTKSQSHKEGYKYFMDSHTSPYEIFCQRPEYCKHIIYREVFDPSNKIFVLLVSWVHQGNLIVPSIRNPRGKYTNMLCKAADITCRVRRVVHGVVMSCTVDVADERSITTSK